MTQPDLSTKAKNVTLVSTGHKIYLKGFVKNNREKVLIEKLALRNSRLSKVINQIQIK